MSGMILKPVTHLFAPEEAARLAAEIQADDPDWEYRVVHDPTGRGKSFISIYDEDGLFVGKI